MPAAGCAMAVTDTKEYFACDVLHQALSRVCAHGVQGSQFRRWGSFSHLSSRQGLPESSPPPNSGARGGLDCAQRRYTKGRRSTFALTRPAQDSRCAVLLATVVLGRVSANTVMGSVAMHGCWIAPVNAGM